MAVLDHLVPAFGRASSPSPVPRGALIPPLDPSINPPVDSQGSRIAVGLTEAAMLAGLVAFIYATYRRSTRRS